MIMCLNYYSSVSNNHHKWVFIALKSCKKYNKIMDFISVCDRNFNGDAGCGKSALVNRYIDGEYHDNYYNTISVDFKIKSFDIP